MNAKHSTQFSKCAVEDPVVKVTVVPDVVELPLARINVIQELTTGSPHCPEAVGQLVVRI